MIRKSLPDLGAVILLLLLPLLLFAPVALGHKTLLPADNLFLNEPYRSAAAEMEVGYPHNHLVSDMILENYPWKRLILDAIHDRELPLWDPYIFAGHPFLANGQHSALYPLSLVFYVLPLWRAYGIFAWLQLGLAGIFAYLFARVLGVRRLGGLVTGITFQFSGFMIVSAAAHPMIIAGASWLPFILAMVELIVQQRPALGHRPATLPWALLGALGLGCQMLAGHAENTYFVLLVTGAYALWRISGEAVKRPAGARRAAAWLALMIVLGLALGAGMYFVSFVAVALVMLCLFVLNAIESAIRSNWYKRITVVCSDLPGKVQQLQDELRRYKVKILDVDYEKDLTAGTLTVSFNARFSRREDASRAYQRLAELPDIKSIKLH